MPDENKFMLTGLVANNPELQRSGAGNPYLRLRLEVSFGQGKANYFPMIAFGGKATEIDQHDLREGARVKVSGRLGRSKRNPEQKYPETDLIVTELELATIQPQIEGEPSPEPSNGDDIPF